MSGDSKNAIRVALEELHGKNCIGEAPEGRMCG